MVLFDYIDHFSIEFVAQSQIHPVFDVGNDDQCAHGRRHGIMRIVVVRLVFDEVFWIIQFSDVVEIGADAGAQAIGSDDVGGSFGQVGHHQAVMVGAGGFDGQTPEQWVV